jgi:DHA1 family tetracycline resistance protein-like MFS transporter
VLSPYGGRLVDRRGPLAFVVAGSIAPAICGVLYTLVPTPVLTIPLILVEATGFAFLSPALFTVVAAGSPAGRSSTAQGVFGAAGTVGTIVASATAGYLAAVDLRLPFWVFAGVMVASLVLGLLVGGRAIAGLAPPPHVQPGPAEARSV